VIYVHAFGGHAARAGDAPAELKSLLESTGGVVRRTNRFIDLALIGARRCAAASKPPPRTGIYVATGQGDVADSALLVEQMLRDRLPPMPFRFVNVSCNTAGFYLSQQLGLSFQTNQMVSTRDFPLESALQIAMLDLSLERCDAALVGAVDECAWPLHEHRQRLGVGPDAPLGEGSHWFLVSRGAEGALARVERLAWPLPPDALEPPAGRTRVRAGKGVGAEAPSWLRDAARDFADVGFYDTNTGYTLGRFLETAPSGERLCHVDRSAEGRWSVLELTRL
jgi:hypothetical protein